MVGPAQQALWSLGHWLIQTEVGLEILLVVGASMALSHVFALLANRLRGRAIVLHLLLDALLLSVAFLLCMAVDILLLRLFASRSVDPSAFLNGVAPCLLPATLYVLAAAPYVGDLIAVLIWAVVHLNVVAFLHVGFQLPYGQALLLCTPGYVLASGLVWLLFRQSWRSGYATLASHLRQA